MKNHSLGCACRRLAGRNVYFDATMVLLGSLLLLPLFPQKAIAQASFKKLTVDRIFKSDELTERSFDPTWSEADGQKYTAVYRSEAVADAKDIIEVDALANKRQVLVSASQLIPNGQSQPIEVEEYQWSSDRNLVLIFTNSRKVWRTNTRGDYYLLNRTSGALRQLGAGLPESSLMFAKFSPDDQQVAYHAQGDLYLESTASGQQRKLTESASGEIINGTTDWVYEEEFDLKDGFRWSPDSSKIAYWQFDTSGVEEFTLINNTDSLYPTLKRFKHTKAGQTNSAVRVGVLDITDGKTTWVSVDGDPRENYIARLRWMSPAKFMIQRLNRDQNVNSVLVVDSETGNAKTLFTDTDKAWVETCDKIFELDNGKRFTWISEKDGWRHVYFVDAITGEMICATPGNYDVIELLHVDDQQMYFVASPKKPTQRYLYRVPVTAGKPGPAQRVTPTGEKGTHRYALSSDGSLAINTWSKFDMPPQVRLVKLPAHSFVRTYTDNADLRKELSALQPVESMFVRVDLGDKTLVDTWIMKPADFDPSKKYPLVVYVYGEPWGSTVTDSWGGSGSLFHRLLCEKGYAVCSIDNRGTKVPRGRDFRKSIYKKVGILAVNDQATAVSALTRHFKWLDSKRVGVWGWSGGGSMSLNAIFKYPEIYQTAIAVAAVPDQAYYDSIYQERYMSSPAKNPDGYRDGSPINFAGQLEGNLLIIHGTGDDNCHYQTVEVLINELVKQDKQFSMMAYPNRSHSISEGENTTVHLRKLMLKYFLANLPAGGR
jgi:dipeptidyl-peptidase-4